MRHRWTTLDGSVMLYLVSFAGGVLTIASPCILPVLPFALSGAGRSFRHHALPLLAGMAITFTAVGSVATLAGDWVVRANQLGRGVALAVFGLLGLAHVLPAIADRLSRPVVRLGAAMQSHQGRATTVGGAFLLGVSTGFLWAPCAGPILGLVLAGAALQGPTADSALLLFSFAAGAACALAVVLLAGNRLMRSLKGAFGFEEWARRAVGVAVLAGVVVIAMGWDTSLLARLSLSTFGTATTFEQQLVDRVRPADESPSMAMAPAPMMMQGASSGASAQKAMPPLDGAVRWLNAGPRTPEGLRGKVVLIDFWTYSCINCLRAIPYVQAWERKYRDQGLVVIGVHTPEFAFERDVDNVARATRDLALTYPVAVDSNRTIWTAFANRFWPAHYLIDRRGKIRYHHFGEGRYEQTEHVIQSLLAGTSDDHAEADTDTDTDTVTVAATGVQAPPNLDDIQSPETYVGYERQENYASPQSITQNRAARYTAPASPSLNQWGLEGQWEVGAEGAALASAGGRIVFRFHARDLHLVLAPGSNRRPIRFRVSLEGAAPGGAKGVDVDATGNGVVTESRLYQLIRQTGPVQDRTFTIEFFEPGVEAFAFTFG